MERTIKTNAKSLCLSEEVLLNAVDFLRRKIVEGDLTVGEYESLSRLFGEGLNLMGTADDFAEFFGKSKNNVRVVLCRKTDAKSVRKVLYPFSAFVKAIPKSWLK